jgi:hypothetical protein
MQHQTPTDVPNAKLELIQVQVFKQAVLIYQAYMENTFLLIYLLLIPMVVLIMEQVNN